MKVDEQKERFKEIFSDLLIFFFQVISFLFKLGHYLHHLLVTCPETQEDGANFSNHGGREIVIKSNKMF